MRLRVISAIGTLLAAVVGALVVAPSSASADSEWWCHGTAVERCATVWWDRSNDTFRARAKITDAAGGGEYGVRVTDVKLLRTSDNGGLVTVRHAADGDGWHNVEDLAATTAVDPCLHPTHSYSVVATFSWRGVSTGQETWSPGNAWVLLCE